MTRKTTRQARWGSGNAEVAGWTELVSESRRSARRQLESDVKRLGADGVVIATMELQARQRDCPGTAGRHDHIAETTLIGTAIARFARAGSLTTAGAGPPCRSTRSGARPLGSGYSCLSDRAIFRLRPGAR